MTNTNFRGPVNSLGAMEDTSINPEDGPSIAYQGTVFPDLRQTLFPKDGVGAGRASSFLDNPQIVTVDNIPSLSTTSIIAVGAATVTGTAMTLLTVAPGNTTASIPSAATGVPIIPFGSSTVTTAAIALDFGFTTGTTTASSSTVVVADSTLFTQGQWICIGGAGNSGKTAALITQVASIANATTITISPVSAGTLTNAPIGSANLWNNLAPPSTQFGPTSPVANAASPYWSAGMFRVFNPIEAISRNVMIQATATAAAGGVFIVNGWDIYGQPMSESLTKAASTTAIFGKKAFKYIKSVIPQFTDATGVYSVGVGDTFGFPIRMDRFEYLAYSWNGITILNQTGFIAAVTSVATATTGDVRGTLQVSTNGNGTGIASGQTSNGAARLWIAQIIPLWNNVAGTPTNTVPFYSVNQA